MAGAKTFTASRDFTGKDGKPHRKGEPVDFQDDAEAQEAVRQGNVSEDAGGGAAKR